MANKRKYPKVVGYWVYTIYIPSIAKYYVGVSKQQCSHRWIKSKYNGTVLEPYLDEFDSMIKTVVVDNLTKEEALKKEDALIQELNDLCVNERRSGLIANDINAYHRECYKNNQEHKKQYYENNKERILERAKQRYLKKKLTKQVNQLTLFDLAS